jgi:hypothetical protein
MLHVGGINPGLPEQGSAVQFSGLNPGKNPERRRRFLIANRQVINSEPETPCL